MSALLVRSIARPPRGLRWLGRALERRPLDGAVPAALWRDALAGPAAEFLARPGKALREAMIEAGWHLGGGAADGRPPERLADVLEVLHAGSLIIDDVEDGSRERRGAPALHAIVGAPLAINTGGWMYFAALEDLVALALPGDALPRTIATLARCHEGQALDLATRVGELDAAYCASVVETITRLKTGALCRLAGELGAIAAGADAARIAAAGEVTETCGIALQMLDDLGSLTAPARRAKGREDVLAARATWPWAWLAEHEPFAWVRLAAEVRDVSADAVDRIADRLAAAVAAPGRACIRATLASALAHLPPHAPIAAALAAMEHAYG